MLLSIIVISHNQKELLKRCIDSILLQALPFEHEIIISDDSSNDGTWELALEYSANNDVISAYQCNTDDFNPINRSSRSGWNRCNGLKHVKGKYVAHVDADDFFMENSKVYQRQVELLEEHPDCSCCMANVYSLKEGENLKSAKLMHHQGFKTGDVIESEFYIRKMFRQSHCFVYRRTDKANPIDLLGGYYVDSIITNFYIQFGNIVCLDDAGYVYVQYKNSIWNENLKTKNYLAFEHAMFMPRLFPKWKYAYMSERRHLISIFKVVKLSLSNYHFDEVTDKWIKKFDSFVYHSFNRKLTIKDRLHLLSLLLLVGSLILFGIKSKRVSDYLFKIL